MLFALANLNLQENVCPEIDFQNASQIFTLNNDCCREAITNIKRVTR
jgi:hypothetical protein